MDQKADQEPSVRIAALEARLEELVGVVEQQAAELRSLRSLRHPGAGPASATVDLDRRPDHDHDHGQAHDPEPSVPLLGRRRLLFGGASAAVATAAAVAATSTPAAAADGDPLILGSQTNASSGRTVLTGSNDIYPALQVESAGGNATGIAGYGTRFGVYGLGLDAGISGQSTDGDGVTGYTYLAGKAGVLGRCSEVVVADGVRGVSVQGRGVSGSSTSGNGVEGVGAIGVRGTSETGTGVQAYSSSGVGLVAGSGESAAIQAIGTGATAIIATSPYSNLSLPPTDARPAPTGDGMAHTKGEIVTDANGNLWICVADGLPGTWRKAAGPTTAGAFHLLPVPVRVYDSRPGTSPNVGSKTKLSGNTSRTLSMSANSSGVPNGASAVALTVLLVNASTAGGNVTIWATGATRPQANAMVWGGSAGRFASTSTCRIDGTTKLNVAASASTDLVLDVVGYYL